MSCINSYDYDYSNGSVEHKKDEEYHNVIAIWTYDGEDPIYVCGGDYGMLIFEDTIWTAGFYETTEFYSEIRSDGKIVHVLVGEPPCCEAGPIYKYLDDPDVLESISDLDITTCLVDVDDSYFNTVSEEEYVSRMTERRNVTEELDWQLFYVFEED